MIPLSEENPIKNKEEDKKKKPRPLKLRGALLVFLLVFFVEFLFLSDHLGRISFEDLLASIAPEELVELTNIRRKEAELDTLTVSSTLEKAAKLKAQDMAEKGYFAHTSPEGVDPWHWFNAVGYSYRYAGENLAVNFTEAYQVDEAWMQSPTHRDNIISESFEEIGIATAEGEYKGSKATFVVQLFGSERGDRPAFASEVEEELAALTEGDEEEAEETVLGEEGEKPETIEEDLEEKVSEEERDVEKEDTAEESTREEEEIEDIEKEEEREVIEKNTEEEIIDEDEEEEKDDKESFAFMERREDEEIVLSIGTPEEVIEYPKIREEKDDEYVSFWGRIVSSPGRFFPYLLSVAGFVFLFSVLLKALFIRRLHLPMVLVNELIIVFILLSAFLTKHAVLQLVGLV